MSLFTPILLLENVKMHHAPLIEIYYTENFNPISYSFIYKLKSI